MLKVLITTMSLLPLFAIEPAQAQPATTQTLEKVTPENYIRAETDRNFENIAKLAGGVNRVFSIRRPTPLDQQTIVRMNRDTLYAGVVVNTQGGATITLPEVPAGRYISAEVIDNDSYCPTVFYTAGTHALPTNATKYLLVAVRIQVFNASDPAEIALVNKLQDQIVIRANSAGPFPPMRWDPVSLKALSAQYDKDAAHYSSWKGMMGPKGQVDEKTRHISVAAAFGLLPEWDATYLNYAGDPNPQNCYRATYQIPENKAFWSITLYGSDGYMKSEDSIVNGHNVKLNPDGTFTAYFGSKSACGDLPNRLDITEGWNFLMRIYRPGPPILDGSYKLPTAEVVK
jgi:hypothetical protein